MWTLKSMTGENIGGLKTGAIEVGDAPFVLVGGPMGAGKSSLLRAGEFALTGRVLSSRGKGLTQKTFRSEDGDLSAACTFVDEAGVDLVISRNLGAKHTVGINALSLPADEGAEVVADALGVTRDDLEGLLDVEAFCSKSAREQARYLSRMISMDVTDLLAVVPADDPAMLACANEILEELAEEGDVSEDVSGPAVKAAVAARIACKNTREEQELAIAEADGGMIAALEGVAALELETEDLAEMQKIVSGAAGDATIALDEGREAVTRYEQALARKEAATIALATAQDNEQKASAALEVVLRTGDDAQAARNVAEAAVDALRETADTAGVALAAAEKRTKDNVAAAVQATTLAVAKCKDEADAAWQAASEAQGVVNAAQESVLELTDALNEGAGSCPVCEREIDDDLRTSLGAKAAATHGEAAAAYDKCKKTEEALAAKLDAAKGDLFDTAIPDPDDHEAQDAAWDASEQAAGALSSAQDALFQLPAVPDETAARDRLTQASKQTTDARTHLEAMGEGLDELEAKSVAVYIEVLETERDNMQAAIRSLDSAETHQALAESIRERQEKTIADRERFDALAKLWEAEAARMVGEEVLGVIEDVCSILIPVMTWRLEWSPAGVSVQGFGFRRQIAQLSRGERAIVGLAWQVALAKKLGVGIVLADDMNLVSADRLGPLMDAVAKVAGKAGVTVLAALPCATPEAMPALPTGCAAVWMDEGTARRLDDAPAGAGTEEE